MTVVLAHGLGGSTDLPIPFTYALIGGELGAHRVFRGPGVRVAHPETGSGQSRAEVAGLGDAVRRRADHAERAGGVRPGARGVGGPRGVLRTRGIVGECTAGRVLRAALGGTGRGVAGVRPGVAGALPGPHGTPIGVRGDRALAGRRQCAVPQLVGLLARGRGTVRPSSGSSSPLATRVPLPPCAPGCWSTSWSRRPGPSRAANAGVSGAIRSRCTARWRRGCLR